MSYQDRQLTCAECGQPFTFTAAEQADFDARGYTNEPKRCPDCRAARRQERGASRGYANGGGGGGGGAGRGYGDRGYGAPRQLFDATCANCGRATQVPFQPRGDRPVYCSDCYAQQGGGRAAGGSRGGYGGRGRRGGDAAGGYGRGGRY